MSIVTGLIRRLFTAVVFTALAPCVSAQNIYALPDETMLSRLVWTTLIEVDSANRTGNYSVLRALGSPSFQQNNSEQNLADLFSELRDNRVDVGRVVTLEPAWHLAPAINDLGILRLRGGFEFRPKAIRFDILFEQVGGSWRILGVSVAQMNTSEK